MGKTYSTSHIRLFSYVRFFPTTKWENILSKFTYKYLTLLLVAVIISLHCVPQPFVYIFSPFITLHFSYLWVLPLDSELSDEDVSFLILIYFFLHLTWWLFHRCSTAFFIYWLNERTSTVRGECKTSTFSERSRTQSPCTLNYFAEVKSVYNYKVLLLWVFTSL